MTRYRSRLIVLALAAQLSAAGQAPAETSPDLGVMLREAQRFTVKVRGTVTWPFSPEQLGTGQGTGFIIDRAKGWVLTNAHVARRSPDATVEVSFGDNEGAWVPVQRLYTDNYLDIAVLKVAVDMLPPDASAAKLGCNRDVKLGSSVVAYGHPINLNFTATRGFVSSVRMLGHQEFVQMDANINPGNSGGPLLAVDSAEVIGINTANFPGAPGLGLATTIRHVCPILEFLVRGADPSVPTIPVYWLKQGRIETLTVATRFGSFGGEPATQGLQSGDAVQILVGGGKLATLPDLYSALRGKRDRVTLVVLRDGVAREVEAPLIPARPPLQRQGLAFAGMMVTEPNTFDTGDSRVPPLRIEHIKPGEAAARASFQVGDLLQTVGGQRFTSVSALHAWLRDRPGKEKVSVLVRRFSSIDPRVTAEFHKLEIQPADLKLIRSED